MIRRTDLLNVAPAEISRHLRSKGISSTIREDATGYDIEGIGATDVQLTTALSDFVSTTPKAQWREPLAGELPTHVQHLKDFAALTPTQLASATPAQLGHVIQDLIRVVKTMLDDRLG